MEEYIKLLDLPDEFNLSDLKKAYRKKVLQYHPDKASSEAERIGYEATMKKLNEANEYIKEYLENHGGKYSKAEYYSSSSYPYDDTYSDENTKEETAYEEESYDENTKEKYEEEQKEYPKKSSVKDKKGLIAFIIFTVLCCLFGLIDRPSDRDIELLLQQKQQQIQQQEQTKQEEQTQQQEETKQEEPQEESLDNSENVMIDKSGPIGQYISYAQKKIVNNWRLPNRELPNNIKVKVLFTLSRDGMLMGAPKIKESSGNYEVDRSCLRAVGYSEPFRSFPEDIEKDKIDIELTFEANKHQ